MGALKPIMEDSRSVLEASRAFLKGSQNQPPIRATPESNGPRRTVNLSMCNIKWNVMPMYGWHNLQATLCQVVVIPLAVVVIVIIVAFATVVVVVVAIEVVVSPPLSSWSRPCPYPFAHQQHVPFDFSKSRV